MMNLTELKPAKILVVNIFGIGDVLFTTPLLRNLRTYFPDAQIDFIANRRVAPLLEDHELIRQVFVYERDEFVAIRKRSRLDFLRKVLAFKRDIQHENYDVLFDFSMNAMFNWISSTVGIRHRLGFNYKNRSRWLTEKMAIKGYEGQHVVQYYLDLLQRCGLDPQPYPLEVTISSENRRWAIDFLQRLGVDVEKPLLAIFPGGGSSWGAAARLKRWGVDNYAKLIHKIVENSAAQIILMGDKGEQDLCAEIIPHCPHIYKSFGQTTLGQLCAVLNLCAGVICNDGGPLHMAVAAGSRTVSLFGPVDSQVYGPWPEGQQHQVVCSQVVCRPCYRKFRMTDCQHVSCLQDLSVEEVLKKVRNIL